MLLKYIVHFKVIPGVAAVIGCGPAAAAAAAAAAAVAIVSVIAIAAASVITITAILSAAILSLCPTSFFFFFDAVLRFCDISTA